MLKMAQVYLEEGSLENAYVLYMKYMTLFLEKIRQHPEYAAVPADVKIKTQAKIREILPKAEKIKVLLLEQYTSEYNKYLAEVKFKFIFWFSLYFSQNLVNNTKHILFCYSIRPSVKRKRKNEESKRRDFAKKNSEKKENPGKSQVPQSHPFSHLLKYKIFIILIQTFLQLHLLQNLSK